MEKTNQEMVAALVTPSDNVVTPPPPQDAPFKMIVRNNYGLITGIDYKFNEDASINWRAMIGKEFLYINPQNKEKLEKKYNKTYENLDIDSDLVEDKDLVILLGGIKCLAQLRGFNSVTYRPIVAHTNYAVTVCRIVWIPNYETEGREVTFESIACASLDNTTGFGNKFLPEMSENRSFCRCVRNFLKINIVSKEEIENQQETDASTMGAGPLLALRNLLETKKLTFADIKEKKLKEGLAEAENWKDLSDIPTEQVELLIKRLRMIKK